MRSRPPGGLGFRLTECNRWADATVSGESQRSALEFPMLENVWDGDIASSHRCELSSLAEQRLDV
jgi:hypothetical protein